MAPLPLGHGIARFQARPTALCHGARGSAWAAHSRSRRRVPLRARPRVTGAPAHLRRPLARVMANWIDVGAEDESVDGTSTMWIAAAAGGVVLEGCGRARGVRAGQLESIFAPCVQGHEPGTSSAGGLGLGLALARSLTELHGGTVHASSGGAGQWSCLTIRLPAPTTA